MGVRQKLNVASVHGCLILAALVGASAGSGLVFLFALIAPVTIGYASGDMRPRRRGG